MLKEQYEYLVNLSTKNSTASNVKYRELVIDLLWEQGRDISNLKQEVQRLQKKVNKDEA